jgi:dTMP kinase
MKGKFVVIEGADCTGKTTQAELLVRKLKSLGKDVVYLEFPTYEKTPGGQTVTWYLEGKFGDLEHVPPEVACLTFALDRYQFAKENQTFLEQGKILIANRYTQSNMGHQGGKFKGPERIKFIDWIEKVESRMPQPEVVVYLDLPVEISQKLKEKRGDTKGAKGKDIHEKDIQHLKDARECYLETAKRKGWILIDCKQKGKEDIRSIDDIHKEIFDKIKGMI